MLILIPSVKGFNEFDLHHFYIGHSLLNEHIAHIYLRDVFFVCMDESLFTFICLISECHIHMLATAE